MHRRSCALTSLTLLGLLVGCRAARDSTADDPRPERPGTVLATGFDGPGEPLEGWTISTSNPRDGSRHAIWDVVEDRDAPTAPGALALVDARGHIAQTFNLCWREELSLADVDVEVRVRADGGEEDQGGGPAWRIGGSHDYYVARWNPLEDNFRVYSVVGGERLQLDSARVRVDHDAWHTIRVRHVGDSITCWLDGVELLHATDTKLMGAGAAGLWTKADATTSFDDFVVVDATR